MKRSTSIGFCKRKSWQNEFFSFPNSNRNFGRFFWPSERSNAADRRTRSRTVTVRRWTSSQWRHVQSILLVDDFYWKTNLKRFFARKIFSFFHRSNFVLMFRRLLFSFFFFSFRSRPIVKSCFVFSFWTFFSFVFQRCEKKRVDFSRWFSRSRNHLGDLFEYYRFTFFRSRKKRDRIRSVSIKKKSFSNFSMNLFL